MGQLLGTLLILNSLVLAGWWITNSRANSGLVLGLCGLAVFAGMFLILQDRATEITVKGVGTIKAAAQQAQVDAQQVAELRGRVERQSATIDAVAAQAVEARKLSEELARKNELADQKLKGIDETLQRATKVLAEQQQLAEFTATVQAAQNDDRRAFDKLRQWAEDRKYPFAGRASQAWRTILDQHSQPWFASGFGVPWREGVDPSKFGIADLKNIYEQVPPALKPALIEYVWNRQDIPKRDRVVFLVDILAKDESLRAVEYAARYLEQEAKLRVKPLAVEEYMKWWRSKGDS